MGGLTWRQCQKYRDIETFYRTALEVNPSCWMAYNNLGALLITKDQLPEAISLIEIAAHRSSIPAAHYDLGLALFKSGRNDEAIASYQRALDLKPRYPEAHYNLALALVKSGRTEEATAHYEEALRIKPDYAEPHNGLGLVLASAGRLPDAISQYEAALRIDPTDAGFHENLGVALFHSGRLDDAIANYEQALKLRRGFGKAQNNLGVALTSANWVPEALFEAAARSDPTDASFRRNLAHALQDEGRGEEVRAQFEAEAQLQANQAARRP